MEEKEKIKYFSRENIISLFMFLFPNKKILDKFSESENGELLYNGKKITDSKLNGTNPLIKQSNISLSMETNTSLEKEHVVLTNNIFLIKDGYNVNHLLSSTSETYNKIEMEET